MPTEGVYVESAEQNQTGAPDALAPRLSPVCSSTCQKLVVDVVCPELEHCTVQRGNRCRIHLAAHHALWLRRPLFPGWLDAIDEVHVHVGRLVKLPATVSQPAHGRAFELADPPAQEREVVVRLLAARPKTARGDEFLLSLSITPEAGEEAGAVVAIQPSNGRSALERGAAPVAAPAAARRRPGGGGPSGWGVRTLPRRRRMGRIQGLERIGDVKLAQLGIGNEVRQLRAPLEAARLEQLNQLVVLSRPQHRKRELPEEAER